MNGSRLAGSDRVRHPARHPETGDGGRLAPRTLSIHAMRVIAAQVTGLSDGQYRWLMGEIRRQKRSLRLGRPVRKVVRKSVRRNAQDIRWSNTIRLLHPTCVAWLRSVGGVPCIGLNAHPSEEAAHIIPRRFKATRLLTENGMGLCRRAHGWFTEHPKDWEFFCRRELGDAKYEHLWRLAHHVKEAS